MISMTESATLQLRAALWFDKGFRPVAVRNAVVGDKTTGKRPKGDEWQIRARQTVPETAMSSPTIDALNTGILCDGLRPIDIDVDDPALVNDIGSLVTEMFGAAPVRFRGDSPRALVLYRAAEGEPRKRQINCARGKVEVLGMGNQFVAYGQHRETGAQLQWSGELPHRDMLPLITEAALDVFFERATAILGGLSKAKHKASDDAFVAYPELVLPAMREPMNREEAYAQAALAENAAELATTCKGGRNDKLNALAYRMGRMVGAGWINGLDVESALLSACHTNGLISEGADETIKTLRSGLEAGKSDALPSLSERPVDPAIAALGQRLFASGRPNAAFETAGCDNVVSPAVFELASGSYPAASLPSSNIVGWGKFIQQAATPPIYVVQRMLQAGYAYALTASWGAGKTAIGVPMALHVSAGRIWAGLKVERSKVLYLCGENPPDVAMRAKTAAREVFKIDDDELEGQIHFTERPFAIDTASAVCLRGRRPQDAKAGREVWSHYRRHGAGAQRGAG